MVQQEVEWRRIRLYLRLRVERFSQTIIIVTGEQHVRVITADLVRTLNPRVRTKAPGITTHRSHSGIAPVVLIAEEATIAAIMEVTALALRGLLPLRVQDLAVGREVVIKKSLDLCLATSRI